MSKELGRILEMKKEDFYKLAEDGSLPEARCTNECGSIVILPTDIEHDSGFNVMMFILLDDNCKPIYKATFGSDVMEVLFKADAWSIDCLPCGLLRFFHHERRTKVVFNVSGFQIKPGSWNKPDIETIS